MRSRASRRSFGPIARTTAVAALALLGAACAPARELAANDPYANCVDLGDLSSLATTRTDAERQMRARVLELGGDTLLFGERGRARRLSESPAEIVERRSRHLAASEAGLGEQPILELTAEEAADPDALATAEGNAERRRTASAAAEELKDSPGELWFYGAALRCGTASR